MPTCIPGCPAIRFRLRVWDVATGDPVGDPFTGHGDWVSAVAVGELDGRAVVVSGGWDQAVRVWDVATGDPVGGAARTLT